MKKKTVNGYLSFVIIIALFMTHSASSRGLVLCIGELNHIQIESKIIANYDECAPYYTDNKQFNVCLLPISRCGSCKDIEPSDVGLMPSTIQKYKTYYQTTSSPPDIQGSTEYILNDDISYRLKKNHDLAYKSIQSIIATTVIIR